MLLYQFFVILSFVNLSFSNVCYLRTSNQCGGRGTCQSNGKCNCQEGWVGTICSVHECNGMKAWDTEVCSGRGQCLGPNQCVCDNLFGGQYCEFRKCFGVPNNNPRVCNGHGSCLFDGTCQCSSDFFGVDCSIEECGGELNEVFCSGHGICNNRVCDCDRGHFGAYCQYHYCFKKVFSASDVCNGHGNCVSYDTCECSEGYFGKECECKWATCASDDQCHGNGECLLCYSGDILSYKLGCVCHEEYDSPRCAPKCFGKSMDDKEVCHGHGSCIDNNICSCDNPHYNGLSCGNWTCFGVSNNDPNVCGGHGRCLNIDACDCDSHFHGSSCGEWECMGLPHREASTCGGKGACLGPDYCACHTPDLGGTACEDDACGGVSVNDLWVCNGRGICDVIPDGDNQCTCPKEFRGNFCEISKCFGVWGDSKTCSGHGVCVDTDICKCDGDFGGENCGKRVRQLGKSSEYVYFKEDVPMNDRSTVRTVQITVYTMILVGVISFFCLVRWAGHLMDWAGQKFLQGDPSREGMVGKFIMGMMGIEDAPVTVFTSSSDDGASILDDTSSMYTTTTATTTSTSIMGSVPNSPKFTASSLNNSSIEETTTTSEEEEDEDESETNERLNNRLSTLVKEELDDSGDGSLDELLASMQLEDDGSETDEDEDDTLLKSLSSHD